MCRLGRGATLIGEKCELCRAYETCELCTFFNGTPTQDLPIGPNRERLDFDEVFNIVMNREPPKPWEK